MSQDDAIEEIKRVHEFYLLDRHPTAHEIFCQEVEQALGLPGWHDQPPIGGERMDFNG